LGKWGDIAGHENAAISHENGVVQGVVKACGRVAIAVNFNGDFVLVVT
jgi:hypothetical protein